MIQAKNRKLTFEEYLNYKDSTDNRYELIDGELIALPPESGLNYFIAMELFWLLAVAEVVPRRLIKIHACEIQVPVLRFSDAANRYPDLVILREEHWELTQNRLTVTLDMPPPQLIVEVVSPGTAGRERDCDRKRAQYAARGIPEYWIVDPQEQIVMVLQLEGDRYIEVGVFQDYDPSQKPQTYL
jgi:Uma2 family endonuclease